ncbi:glycosyltransferase [Calditerricola satsumensis]|uniref:Glycosyltransferase subfamily 4-like N-terminal domain-containing protein n=2 Tax=Calditerricola satsumensis TaxID=373054 RepID=A0A8J3BA27_9BACI|nr:glycosyltransferase [Calditerricola satsumensis]GGJ91158.1 hypothetical protein GCM10007043_01080 [Calditerricola satsumensis]
MTRRVLVLVERLGATGDAGALRAARLTAHLGEWGWEPVVVHPEGDAVALDENTARRLLAVVRVVDPPLIGRTGASSQGIRWLLGVTRVAARVAKRFAVQAILSTGSAWWAHAAAWRLKRGTGLPWLADVPTLPDWVQDDTGGGRTVRLWRSLYRAALRGADALTVPSAALAAALQPVADPPDLAVIPPGFDPGEWRGTPPEERAKGFVAVHVGGYGLDDPPCGLMPVLSALEALHREPVFRRERWAVRLVAEGRDARFADAQQWAQGARKPWLTIQTAVDRDAVLAAMRGANLLLYVGGGRRGIVLPDHVGDYAACGRPVLAVASREEAAELARAGVAAHWVEADDMAAFRLAFYRAYRLWKRGVAAPRRRAAEAAAALPWRERARRLAAILDSLVMMRAGRARQQKAVTEG